MSGTLKRVCDQSDMLFVHLCVGQPQAGHAAVGFTVDGAELLFNGGEISHESVQVHIFSLV